MDDRKLTPMLSQYRQIKARFPDALVLFRLGDFYETFEADARIAARELDLVLTSRSFAKGVRLAMAGVPHHHVSGYIARLIEKGHKVALVEQLEDPRRVKRLVKRDVIRVITPGTVVEDALLRSAADNYLAAIVRAEQGYGLAWIDISTGDFGAVQVTGPDASAHLLDELHRLQPSEYVLPQSLAGDAQWCARLSAVHPARLSPLPDPAASFETAERELLAHFQVTTLQGFGCADSPLAVCAAGLILQYLQSNQPNGDNRSSLPHINNLRTHSLSEFMALDSATRRNLELIDPLQPDSTGHTTHPRSLFGVMDHTLTPMGARLLKRWFQQPLLDLEQIHLRLGAVDELYHDGFLRGDLRKLLEGLHDIERLAGRIGFGSANARDLIGLNRALLRLPRIKARLAQASSPLLCELERGMDELADVSDLLGRSLVPDPPILVKDGGLIRAGYDPTLDELRSAAADNEGLLSGIEVQERQRTGIKNLRVRYNDLLGFFIEVPRSLGHLIPAEYDRRASISHAERFTTPELRACESRLLVAQDRVKQLEYDLFLEVRREVARHVARVQSAARTLARLDALLSLAETAARYGYVRPELDDGDCIEIHQGRHPVVERFGREGQTFVPNDICLDADRRVIVLTGPNMSGKSVFIRQVALIVLLAQVGSFVPATFAHIGLTDRIFTRVGASDDIAQGRSTFLVEMSETSQILRHATERSLIVLDEVGRGTSTYDGISLAWAIAEELHNTIRAKTLFATHYHELTELESAPALEPHGSAVKNLTMAVEEDGNTVIFLRQVIPGGAEKSFGIHVARLAGLPAHVVARAEAVLRDLEGDRHLRPARTGSALELAPAGSGELFHGARELSPLYTALKPVWQSALEQVATADIANLTPIQALNLLNELQLLVRQA